MKPYKGNEPYIFISYAHKDASRVLPIIETLSDNGYRVWYDVGIEAGTEWPDYIAENLVNSAVVMVFLSPSSISSPNCRQEINFAISRNRQLLTVYLEELKLPLGLDMQLGLVQALFAYRHPSKSSFMNALMASNLLTPCRDMPLVPMPYQDNQPYIFASFAKEDEENVMPYLIMLQQKGCRIFYDPITARPNWLELLVLKLKGCAQFLLFASTASTGSLWIKSIVQKASTLPAVPIVTVRMDDSRFDDAIETLLDQHQQLLAKDPHFKNTLLSSIRKDVIAFSND